MTEATPEVSISIENRLEEIGRVADLLDTYCRQCDVPQAVVNDMHVAVDEAVSNVVRHGFDDGAVHRIDVRIGVSGGWLTACVRDDGRAFDPLADPVQAGKGDLGGRGVGGLGLLFMRQLTDRIDYRRVEGCNELTLRRRTDGTATADVAAPSDPGTRPVAVVEINGRIDSASAPALHERLAALAVTPGARIVIDLAEASYLTSAGFWAILAAARQVRVQGGELVLCSIPAPVARLFDAGGFAPLFRVHPDREAAIRALST